MSSILSLVLLAPFLFFFFYCSRPHRDLHSFPTRRSSDLAAGALAFCKRSAIGKPSSQKYAIMRWPLNPSEASALSDRKSTRLNSSHLGISYAVFCLKKKKKKQKKIVHKHKYQIQ